MAKTPFVSAANCAQIETPAQVGLQVCENVFTFQLAAQPDAAMLTTLANRVMQWISEDASNLYHDGYQLQKVAAHDMTVQEGVGVEVTPTGAGIAGKDATGHTPNNVTFAIKHSTGFRGRSRRGRTYWLAIPRGVLQPNSNFLNDTYVANVVASMGRLLAAMHTLGADMVVVSKRHDNAWRTAALVTPVTNFTADDAVDSQRRRLAGRGK